jgi:hypothetical protein
MQKTFLLSAPLYRLAQHLLVTANIVSSMPILSTLLMEEVCAAKMSVLTRATWHNIPEDDILHSDRRENLKSYTALTGWIPSGDVMCLL